MTFPPLLQAKACPITYAHILVYHHQWTLNMITFKDSFDCSPGNHIILHSNRQSVINPVISPYLWQCFDSHLKHEMVSLWVFHTFHMMLLKSTEVFIAYLHIFFGEMHCQIIYLL